MIKTSKSALLRASAAPMILGAALLSMPAFAQETPAAAPQAAPEAAAEDEGQVIIVTGTRIARPDLEAASPVTVVTGESIKLSGQTGVEEFLRDVPQATPAIGGNTNNGNPGAATIDLRNLGEERTLVLVNGKRFVPYDGDGIVDLNMIPSALVERVEVLTGGASSVYGSDAIAGVVNFVMKSDFEGFQADAQYGITEEGDGANRSFSITMGMNSADGRGNIVMNATYTKVDAVDQGSRSFSRNVLAAADLGPGGGSSTNAAGTIRSIPGSACAGGSTAGVCTFDANGNLVPYVASRDGFNFNPYNLLQAPQDKWTATALGHYELTDAVEFYGRASFANSQVTTIVAPSGTFNFPFEINYATNPFLNSQARSVLAAADAIDSSPNDGFVTLPVGRRTVELGTRDSIYENTAYQVVGGFKGDITDNIQWEVFGQWGKTKRTITYANDISFSRTQQALLAVNGPNGPQCMDTSGGCVPANLFGAGNLSQEAGNFIRLDLQQHDSTSQLVTGGFISGDLPFTLASDKPGAFVIGAEYRRERTKANPDENLRQGNAPGFGSSTPVDAQFSVREVYGELKLPILDMFSVEGGIRYADYKNKDNLTGQGNDFTNTSWKVGADFEPIEDIRFRAMYQRAVRAPNLNELGQPLTPSTGDVDTDYCSSDNLTPADYAAGGTLAQLCLATGVPSSAAANGIVGGPIAGQVNNYLGGNIDLEPEKATTITIGAVIQPRFLPGFTASVDYFDIKVKNAIINIPEQDIVDACYLFEQDANGTFCSLIHRNPIDGSLIGGTETGVDAREINAGLQRTRGIDIAAAYRFDIMEDARLTLAVNATRTIRSDFQAASVLPVRHCAGLVGSICLRPLPKWQWVQTTTFNKGPFTAQLRWQYIGKLTNDTVAFGQAPASDFAVPVIGARSYFDFSSEYEVNDNFALRFGVENIFDKKPPVVGNDYGGTTENSGNTYPATYDPLGRKYFVGATLKF